MEKILEQVYYNLDYPSAYAGINKLYSEAKHLNPKITLKNVTEFLKRQRTYTLHKPQRKRFRRLQTIASGLHSDWQCDLVVLDYLHRYNKSFKYILVCIDVLSRQVFVSPVKTKKSTDMIKAFDQIFTKSKYKPWKLMSDRGLEFTSKEMKDYFSRHQILKYSMESAIFHAGLVERVNRTIKEKLFKYFQKNNTRNWVDIIDRITDTINNSVHRITGQAPKSITFDNAEMLRKKLYINTPLISKPKFQIGDYVRTALHKGPFGKGYLPNFSEEVYKIKSIANTKPITYTIENLKGQTLLGKYYTPELVLTVLDNRAIIEKILRKRTLEDGSRELYVKWTGQPSSENSWIRETDYLF